MGAGVGLGEIRGEESRKAWSGLGMQRKQVWPAGEVQVWVLSGCDHRESGAQVWGVGKLVKKRMRCRVGGMC